MMGFSFLPILVLFPAVVHGLPLCIDSRAPFAPKAPLSFCSSNGSVCCSADDDSSLQKQFSSMNISNPACASLIQSLLCAKCDPFSADLFTVKSQIRTVPILCHSTLSVSSAISKGSTKDFCGQVWDTCKDVTITNSPFWNSSQDSDKLADFWNSKNDFCKEFGGSVGSPSVCFDGKTVLFNNSQDAPLPKGLCLERIWNGSYLNMVPHPDGSNRVFLSNQAGKIWLATIPEEESGKLLDLDESNPFLDISDQVYFNNEFGMLGLAFHPKFTSNGRFFVSYNCDRSKVASCAGRCSCNSDVNCDPTKLGTDNGSPPCQFQSVIAEFTSNSSSSTPSLVTTASPTEVKRIFTMGLPYTSHHAGQILFGPTDGFLYFMMGDGGKNGDPINFSQNKKSLLGKIMRFDIDNFSNTKQTNDMDLWGNYSIPHDNPYVVDKEWRPEIWALGFRNPWRCSFDSEMTSYFYCADVGEDVYEEVDLITKGGNYGWGVYEGPFLYNASVSLGRNTNASSISVISPVMGYDHSILDLTNAKSASITGGYVYRSSTDPCMTGRYLYADLYALNMWSGTETPKNSGNYSSRPIPFSCASDSPIPCESVAGSPLPSLGYIFSFGEDNRKDIFVLAYKGVYRVVRPSRCNYTCPVERIIDKKSPSSGQSPSISSLDYSRHKLILMAFLFLLTLS